MNEVQSPSRHAPLYSSKKWDWETPQDRWDRWNQIFGFTLDVAASPLNNKCEDYFTEEDNALMQSWETEGLWWCNRPWGVEYTKATGITSSDWAAKCVREWAEGREGVAIVAARTDTGWWQDNIRWVPYVLFLRGRINYLHPDVEKSQGNFPSALWVFFEPSQKQLLMLSMEGWLVKTHKIPQRVLE